MFRCRAGGSFILDTLLVPAWGEFLWGNEKHWESRFGCPAKADHEESEIIQEFVNMARAIMGSGLQAVEQAQRRASMSQTEASAQEAR